MSSIDQTLRKARQVEERFKKFMEKKVEQDKSIEQTYKRIDKAQETLKETKETIGSIDKLYDRLQQVLSKTIDNAVSNIENNTLFNVAKVGWVPNKIDPKITAQILRGKKKILVMTGAGISAASGIPTFRGAGGFWSKQKVQINPDQTQENITPQIILTNAFYTKYPQKTWKWLLNFYNLKKKAKPNKGHVALSQILEQLKEKGKQVCLLTQNIDNFHTETKNERKAKNKNLKDYPIFEIHGNITKIRCQYCSFENKQLKSFNFEEYIKILAEKKTATCPICKRQLRPHIMFFDEFYDQTLNKSDTINDYLGEVDLVMIIGTALQTGLVSSIVQKCLERKIQMIQLNIECEIKQSIVAWLEGKAEQLLEQIRFQLWKK